MSKFEIISVDLYSGNFCVVEGEGENVVEVMKKYFGKGSEEMVEGELKENKKGWYMKFEEESYVIRELK